MIQITECPRDAMQGIKAFIPTKTKIDYINELLKIGFHTLDCGSFVSPKAIPQMADTKDVLSKISDKKNTKLLTIIANQRGADEAVQQDLIDYLGYPLSISEEFQRRNTNRSIADALIDVEVINNLCIKHKKKLVTYISMGFGNPYGDAWNADIVSQWVEKLQNIDIEIISLSDTVGEASLEDISYIFKNVLADFPNLTIGAHFHATPQTTLSKIEAAYLAGCRRFDTAMLGFGGCPMAKDDLTGNIATNKLVEYLSSKEEVLDLDMAQFAVCERIASEIFGQYH